jgi:hypothetical protein
MANTGKRIVPGWAGCVWRVAVAGEPVLASGPINQERSGCGAAKIEG